MYDQNLTIFLISYPKIGCVVLDLQHIVKPALSGHSKIDKTKVLKTGSSLVHVKGIAECSNREHSAILLTCNKRLSV